MVVVVLLVSLRVLSWSVRSFFSWTGEAKRAPFVIHLPLY